MSFKLNNHPNKSNSGLKFSEQKQNETLQKQKEAIQRITDRKNQPEAETRHRKPTCQFNKTFVISEINK